MADIDELYFMKFDNTPNTGAGLITKSKVEILDDLKTISRASFGSDLSIEQGTAWYVFLDFLADGLNSISAATKELYNSIGIPNAYGVTLDAAVSLCGITRKEGESDEQLRYKAITSMYKQAVGITQGLEASLLNLPFIRYAKVIDNPTNSAITVDGTQIPAYSFWTIIDTNISNYIADDKRITAEQKQQVANSIFENKSLGSATFGTISQTITIDNVEYTIKFSLPTAVNISKIVITSIDTISEADQTILRQNIDEAINHMSPGKTITISDINDIIANSILTTKNITLTQVLFTTTIDSQEQTATLYLKLGINQIPWFSGASSSIQFNTIS